MHPSTSTLNLPKTVATPVDRLRIDDRVFVGHDDEDFWARISGGDTDSPVVVVVEVAAVAPTAPPRDGSRRTDAAGCGGPPDVG